MNSFNRIVLRWARLHPDDPLSTYFIKSYDESVARKKAERKKWKLIAEALDYLGKDIEGRTSRE
jgi:hypothetical protein